MKIKAIVDKSVNGIVNHSFNLIIKLTASLPLKGIMSILSIYSTFLSPHFSKQFRSKSAQFHTVEICRVCNNNFVIEYIRAQLFSQYLRRYLFSYPKVKCEIFVQKSIENLPNISNENITKLYLCTHSGDYWLSILTIAYQYRNSSSGIKQLIVPIYEEITEQNINIFAKIEIKDFDVIFLHIHEPGALKKIMTYLRDDISAVAIFYDLFCYAAGTLNGSVEKVRFFNQSAYMTTGFSSLVVRFNIPTKFVSTHYCSDKGRFITALSEIKYFDDTHLLRDEMVNFIEKYIQDYPAQWHFISQLDTFYHYPFVQLQKAQENKINSYHRLQHKYLT